MASLVAWVLVAPVEGPKVACAATPLIAEVQQRVRVETSGSGTVAALAVPHPHSYFKTFKRRLRGSGACGCRVPDLRQPVAQFTVTVTVWVNAGATSFTHGCA